MKKALLVATVQSHIGQFHKPLVQMLHEHGVEVHAAAYDNLDEKNGLSLSFVDKVFDVPFSRSPKSPSNIKAYRELKRIIEQGEYDFIHCNTPMGGIVTRLASRKARKKGSIVIYTAHGFHFYHGAPKKNWIFFYPIEKIMAHFCDRLVTITDEDHRLASSKFKTDVYRIHGVGVYEDRYRPVDSEEERADLLIKEEIDTSCFVILCVGELNDNKSQKTLVEAVSLLKNDIPEIKVLLAGNGPNEEALRKQIADLGVSDQVKLLGYRTDLENITPAVDLVVSCSYREGLPLNILEAMLCKRAVVASVNRGHRELVGDGVTGMLFEPGDVEGLKERIYRLRESKEERESFGDAGYLKAREYTASAVMKELEKVYSL